MAVKLDAFLPAGQSWPTFYCRAPSTIEQTPLSCRRSGRRRSRSCRSGRSGAARPSAGSAGPRTSAGLPSSSVRQSGCIFCYANAWRMHFKEIIICSSRTNRGGGLARADVRERPTLHGEGDRRAERLRDLRDGAVSLYRLERQFSHLIGLVFAEAMKRVPSAHLKM